MYNVRLTCAAFGDDAETNTRVFDGASAVLHSCELIFDDLTQNCTFSFLYYYYYYFFIGHDRSSVNFCYLYMYLSYG